MNVGFHAGYKILYSNLVRWPNELSETDILAESDICELLAVPLKVPVLKHLRMIKRCSGNGANRFTFDGIQNISPLRPNIY